MTTACLILAKLIPPALETVASACVPFTAHLSAADLMLLICI
jgi:hypothetical protein